MRSASIWPPLGAFTRLFRVPFFAIILLLLVGSCEWSAHSQFAFQQILSFGDTADKGGSPIGTLAEGTDGVLYGTTYTGGVSDRGVVFRINKDGSDYRVIHAFNAVGADGANPYTGLSLGPDGAFYGPTEFGGNGAGTIFRINPDGSGYRVLFRGTAGAGGAARPRGRVVFGDDGAIYGTMYYGGSGDNGLVYKLNRDGTGFRVLHSFLFSPDGALPTAGLIKGSDGRLYGTTRMGGTNVESTFGYSTGGTVFALNQDGGGYQVLYRFRGVTYRDGASPAGELVEGSDEVLYGTTQYGGIEQTSIFDPGDLGTVFRINKDGTGYRVLRRMLEDGMGPAQPHAHLVEGSDGALYGTAIGSSETNTIFKINKDGSGFDVLATPGSANPWAGLLRGSDGLLYGVSRTGGAGGEEGDLPAGALFKVNEDGSGHAILRSFAVVRFGESKPRAPLLLASTGKFYGTTAEGGISNAGTVFVVNGDGSGFRRLRSFGVPLGDARTPNGLIEASDGMLYGTARFGGTAGLGAVFKMDKDGLDYRVLYNFNAPTEGQDPRGLLLEASDSTLYGCTSIGGVSGRGTVFKLNRDGSGFIVLHSFAGAPDDGLAVEAELEEWTDGLLYGTTRLGGSASRGTLFRLRKDGTGYEVLRSFQGGADGQGPYAGLCLARDGALYGVTSAGGSGHGTIFRLANAGSEYQILYRMTGTNDDGRFPRGRLIDSPEGMLYGTTDRGGTAGLGTVFAINRDGSGYSVLWSFGATADAAQRPTVSLTRSPSGVLYGTTELGGGAGLGTLFRLDPTPVRLSIQAQGGHSAIVTWSVSSTSDQLESAIRLEGNVNDWGVFEGMVTKEEQQYRATVLLEGASRYLRLRRMWP